MVIVTFSGNLNYRSLLWTLAAIAIASSDASVSTLRGAATGAGHDENIRTPPDFTCFQAAWVDDDAEAACGGSSSSDGSDCVWCSANGNKVGACLSNDEASMADGQFGLSCQSEKRVELQSSDLEGGLPDIACFRAAWDADNAETACNKSMTSNGSNCVWCSTTGDSMGACLSPSEASMANGQFGLSCPSEKGKASLDME